MSISGNQDFGPLGGFDDAPDVRRHDARDKVAADAAVEIDRIIRGPQSLLAQQALVDSSSNERPILHIVDGVETPIFDVLGHHLDPSSNLSTNAKIDLMEAMLQEKERQDAVAAYNAERRRAKTHEARNTGGILLRLPVNKRPGKYGPKRTGKL